MRRAIVLHGRGQSAALIRELIIDRLDLDLEYIVPEAPGHTWYPQSFLAPRAENQAQLDGALAHLDALVRDGDALIGFSQGACLACEYAYRRPVAALVAFTGGLVGPPETAWPERDELLAGMPVLLGGSARDPFVPAERMLATAEAMRRRGARVEIELFEGDAHAIADAQIVAARAILQ